MKYHTWCFGVQIVKHTPLIPSTHVLRCDQRVTQTQTEGKKIRLRKGMGSKIRAYQVLKLIKECAEYTEAATVLLRNRCLVQPSGAKIKYWQSKY